MDDPIERLEKLCEEATTSKWVTDCSRAIVALDLGGQPVIGEMYGDYDAEYIAAFDPPTTAALLCFVREVRRICMPGVKGIPFCKAEDLRAADATLRKDLR